MGVLVEGLATRRKQKKNLDVPGISQTNAFVVLSSLDNNVLVQIAKELDIRLASDDEGSKNIITVIKAEEKLRASLDEVAYKNHMESLKHRECIRDDDTLDLCVIDNSHRYYNELSDSNADKSKKKKRNQKEPKKRRK
jgi:hypothetical protein